MSREDRSSPMCSRPVCTELHGEFPKVDITSMEKVYGLPINIWNLFQSNTKRFSKRLQITPKIFARDCIHNQGSSAKNTSFFLYIYELNITSKLHGFAAKRCNSGNRCEIHC
jgi:hypothetical protein